MTEQEFQKFVVEQLTSLDSKVTSLDSRVGTLEQSVQWLRKDVHGLRDEFHDFRDEQRQENAVLRALSAQSFQHISDIKAEMMPSWKVGTTWKPTK